MQQLYPRIPKALTIGVVGAFAFLRHDSLRWDIPASGIRAGEGLNVKLTINSTGTLRVGLCPMGMLPESVLCLWMGLNAGRLVRREALAWASNGSAPSG